MDHITLSLMKNLPLWMREEYEEGGTLPITRETCERLIEFFERKLGIKIELEKICSEEIFAEIDLFYKKLEAISK